MKAAVQELASTITILRRVIVLAEDERENEIQPRVTDPINRHLKASLCRSHFTSLSGPDSSET